jgi:hypothetical protein
MFLNVSRDVVALVEPRGWGEQFCVYRLLYADERLSADDTQRLFGAAKNAAE